MEQDRAPDVLSHHAELARSPLLTHDVIVNLIANTTTHAGLTIKAKLDKRTYPLGVEFTKAEFGTLNIKPASFHGDWNYVITPHAPA